jgi:hypothetical protein
MKQASLWSSKGQGSRKRRVRLASSTLHSLKAPILQEHHQSERGKYAKSHKRNTEWINRGHSEHGQAPIPTPAPCSCETWNSKNGSRMDRGVTAITRCALLRTGFISPCQEPGAGIWAAFTYRHTSAPMSPPEAVRNPNFDRFKAGWH